MGFSVLARDAAVIGKTLHVQSMGLAAKMDARNGDAIDTLLYGL